MSRKALFTVFVVFILALAWCIPSLGQVIKGSISGTVIDPQGAVVSGAQVKAKHVETGEVFNTTTGNSGEFRINLVPTGNYSVDITAPGFKTAQSKIAVSAGENTSVGRVGLVLGDTGVTVEVTATAPLIDTTQSQVSSVFSGTALNSFAGIQENEGLDRLALFVPGVVATRSDNFSNTNGVGFSSNGLRGRNNDQEIDGQNNNDNSVGGPGLFLSNTEFVGQYVLITNNFGPEYGRNAGSVVNVITKSGTNNWHGVVFGQERSNFLAALSNTQKNTNKPGSPPCPAGTLICNPFTGPPRFNEEFSGGAIGGPILKNKVFIFSGFDSDLFSGQSVFTTTSLTPTPTGLAQLAGCGTNATAVSVLNTFGPYSVSAGNPTPRNISTTNIGTCTGVNAVQVGGVTRILPTPFHGFDWVLKNDINLKNDSVTARYLFNRNNTFNSGDNSAAGWLINVPALSQAILVSWTHNLSSHMVNEARISFSRLGVEFGGGFNPLEPDAGHLDQAFTNISFQAGGFLGFGPATNLPQSRLVNTWQFQDNWNYVKGRHSFKAGVNWTYQRSPNIFLPNINGAYRFTNLNAFLTTDQPNRIIIANGQPALDFREKDVFLYFGDDWKIGQNLTLNLGLTWTYYGQPGNLFNQITTKRENDPAQAFWLQSLPLSARTDAALSSIKNSFGPSIGFAYQPGWGGFITGHGKTTIRGGYRLSYDPPFYNIFVNISSAAPMTFLQTLTAASNPTVTGHLLPGIPTGPNVRASLAAVLAHNVFDPRTNNETNIASTFGPDKVHSWSLGAEREISKSAAFEARYVGNHGLNLFQTVDANPFVGQNAANPGQIQGGLLPAGTPSCQVTAQSGPGAGTDLGRLACGLGVARSRTNGGFSDYQALQTEFRANNLFKQLTVRAGYTWSRATDNVSEIFATGSAGNTLFAAQNPLQTGGAERATSGLSIPNAFTLIAIEQIPFYKSQHGLLGHILGGWTISADYVLASGQGYTPDQGNAEAFSYSQAPGALFPNSYDAGYVAAFVGVDSARPFWGNKNAGLSTVGVFALDACGGGGLANPGAAFTCTAAQVAFVNALPANQLVSVASLNSGGTPVVVTNNDVRYILNTREAWAVFGTPFGNVPRNAARDARSNLVNATIYKSLKLGEKATFTMNLTLNNALNHFNFGSIIPTLEQSSVSGRAGFGFFGNDFANPAATGANGRSIWVGGKVSF